MSTEQQRKNDLIPKGNAFSVVLVVEAVGNRLIKLRSPLKPIEWAGDWALDSNLWDHKLQQVIGKEHF